MSNELSIKSSRLFASARCSRKDPVISRMMYKTISNELNAFRPSFNRCEFFIDSSKNMVAATRTVNPYKGISKCGFQY